MSKMIVNGLLVDESEANISMLNKDMQLGLSVFETMLAVDGQIDGFELHLERFQSGLERLGLELSDFDQLEALVNELLEANNLIDSRTKVRMTAMGEQYWIEAQEAPERPDTCSVILSDFVLNERSPTAGVKCGSYADNFLSLHEAHSADADEVIFLNTVGEVAEAATANVFLIKDGAMITPHLESGCLPGVTRALVMQRASAAGIEVQSRSVSLDELLDADEVFLTNTQIGVQAVERIGQIELAESPSDMTTAIKALYLLGRGK